MARIRTIKPEFWRSPSTASASPWARLLYIAMWNWADDHGRAEWTPRELLGFAFPHDTEAPCTDAEFPRLCAEVADSFGTVFYINAGRRFYAIPAWDKHQRNERRAASRMPAPDDSESSPDQGIYGMHGISVPVVGSSVETVGETSLGTGEQGNKGNRGTGEQSPSPSAIESAFESAWHRWPKKVEKKQALDKFKRACKTRDPEELADDIARFGDAYAVTTEKQFVPGLAVWINGERWTDELPQIQHHQRQPKSVSHLDVIRELEGREDATLGGWQAAPIRELA